MVLDVVSGTPAWGSSFFGADTREHAQYRKCGFLVHRNCWPVGGKRFNRFKDAMYAPGDLLPMLVGEVLYPLELIGSKGLGGYHHIDANISKIIIPGRCAGHNFELLKKAVGAGGGGRVAVSPAAKDEEATPPRALAPTLEDEEATPPRTAALTATRVLHVLRSM